MTCKGRVRTTGCVRDYYCCCSSVYITRKGRVRDTGFRVVYVVLRVPCRFTFVAQYTWRAKRTGKRLGYTIYSRLFDSCITLYSVGKTVN